MTLKTINIMKKLIFLLLLVLPFVGFGQAAYLMEFTNPNGSKVVFNLNDVRSCVAEGTGSYLFTRTGSGKTQVQESPATIATNSCGNIVLFTVYLPANQFNTTKQMGVNPNYVVGVVSNTSGNGVLKMVTPTENFTTTGDYDAAVSALSNCVSGGGGGGSLTNTYVGFGDGLNQLDGEAGFTYDAEANRLAVDTVKTKRISSKSGQLELLNEIKFNAYPNTRNDAGKPVNLLTTNSSGGVESHPVSDLRDSLGFAWRKSSSFSTLQAAFDSPFNIVVDKNYTATAILTLTVPKEIIGVNGATITQVTAATSTTPIIIVTASNVRLSGVKLVGQIATQTSEFSHGIQIGDGTTSAKNIKIENVEISDCRGDGILAYTRAENLTIEGVKINNCLRNGVALIDATGVTISNCRISSVGLYGVDAEPDVVSQYVENVTISDCVLPSVTFGHHLAQNNFRLHAKNLTIDNSLRGSTPAYGIGVAASKITISLRNVDNILFENCEVKNSGFVAIAYVSGAQKSTSIKFDNCRFFNNGIVDFPVRMIDVQGAFFDNAVTYVNCSFRGAGERYLHSPRGSTFENCIISNFAQAFEVFGQKIYYSTISVSGPVLYYMGDTSIVRNSQISAQTLFFGDGSGTAYFEASDNRFLNFTDAQLGDGTLLAYNNFGNTDNQFRANPDGGIEISKQTVAPAAPGSDAGFSVINDAYYTWNPVTNAWDAMLTSANNGASLTGSTVQLGNAIGSTASALTSRRIVPMGTNSLSFVNADTSATSAYFDKDLQIFGDKDIIGSNGRAFFQPALNRYVFGNTTATTFTGGGNSNVYVFGNNTVSNGYSWALGINNTISSGFVALAMGRFNTFNGSDFGLVAGYNNTHSGQRSVLFGLTSTITSTALNSGVFGGSCVVSGEEAYAYGYSATSSGFRSVAIGPGAVASGINSFAANGGNSSGLGAISFSSGVSTDTNATSFGYGRALGRGTFASGLQEGAPTIIVSGKGSYGHFAVDNNAVVGNGVLSRYSAILGGRNPNLPVGFDRCVILGGDQIRPTSVKTDVVFVPKLSLFNVPSTATITASSTALIRDAASEGETKVATLAAIITAGGAVTSLAAVGSTPNANAATITGSTLNLEPASATHKGVISLTQLKFPLKMTVVDGNTDVPGAGLQTYEVIRIPACYDGYSISDVSYGVWKTGATGTAEMQIRRNGSGTAGVTFTAGQAVKDVTLTGVTVSTGDLIDVEIISNSMATPQQGLWVTIFLTPH